MATSPHQLDTSRPFNRAMARQAGITVSELLSGRYRRLFFDCYVAADVVVTPPLLARAALFVSAPGSHVTHFTAARLWGGVVPDDPDVHVSVPGQATRSRRRGIKAHMASPVAEVVVHRGVPCSSPVQAVLDLGSRLGLVDLVVLGDSLVKAGCLTPDELVAAADAWTGYGARLTRRAVRLVRTGVDSAMETRVRVLLVLAGLPEPVVQLQITSRDGKRHYRLDLAYPAWRIAIEYEGRHHAEDAAQWGHDVRRREDLDELDIRLLIIRSEGIYVDPGETLERIVGVLRSRGVRGVTITSNEWERHFPSRRAAA